jgi:hypothetical protein
MMQRCMTGCVSVIMLIIIRTSNFPNFRIDFISSAAQRTSLQSDKYGHFSRLPCTAAFEHDNSWASIVVVD